jgi:hypothetical protein
MIRLLSLFAAFIFSEQALAWGDLGHGAIGYIAETHLSAQAKRYMNSLMGEEPMALSSNWPDRVRDESRFDDFGPYHYMEIPEGMKYADMPDDLKADRSADTILEQTHEMLLNRKPLQKLLLTQKQILMRFYIHILGDVHQPLHVGNGQDRGGNLCDVRMLDHETQRSNRVNLHAAWDNNLVDLIKKDVQAQVRGIRYFSYKHLADYILQEAKKSGQLEEIKKQVASTTKNDWLDESRALHALVYPGEVTNPREREYCKIVDAEGKVENGKYDASKIPVLTPEYIEKAKLIIKKQILLAGFRLAQQIEVLAKARPGKDWTAEKEKKYFEKIMPVSKKSKNRNPSSVPNRPQPQPKKIEQVDFCKDHAH